MTDQEAFNEAHRTLQDAIKLVISLDKDNQTGLLTDFMVIAAVQDFTEDGEPTVAIVPIVSDHTPTYRLMGLLEFLKVSLDGLVQSQHR